MSQLQSDLRVCFGFSWDNAEKAEALWRARELPIKYSRVIERLFSNPKIGVNDPTGLFNKLNYQISIGKFDK